MEIVFLAQAVMLYVVVVAAILNLALTDSHTTMWTALLSSSLGYMLPHPKTHKSSVGERSTSHARSAIGQTP